MKKILTFVLAAAAFCSLSTPACSANANSAEPALATPYARHQLELMGMFENMTAVLKTVNSTSSANAAAARLLPFVSQSKDLISRARTLEAPSKEVEKKVDELLNGRSVNAALGLQEELMRLASAKFYGSSALSQAVKAFYATGR